MSKENETLTYIHPQGIVEPGATIGSDTRVWAWAHILSGAKLGKDCNICDRTFIENDVIIGDRVTVKCGVSIWDGIIIEDDVFIGPSVSFTNDKFPRSKQYPDHFLKTHIGKGASIGANATILPVNIGCYAMIGAGAVVTKNVPPFAIVTGNPARIRGYVNTHKMTSALPQTELGENITGKTGAQIIPIPSYSDIRGDLSVIEFHSFVPFEIQRIFYTYNSKTTQARGEHAHRSCKEFLIAVHGSLNVIVDNSIVREEFILDNPQQGLLLPNNCWGIEYNHSPDCVLLVLASEKNDSSGYILDYNEFIKYKNESNNKR